jgi:hypothetical protein
LTTSRQLRVGDEAAAGVLRPGGAVVHQRQVPPLTSSRRIGAACETAQKFADAGSRPARRVDVDREVGQGAPEVDEREAVARAAVVEAAVVDLDLAVDRHVGRRGAEAGDLGVVADLELQRLVAVP